MIVTEKRVIEELTAWITSICDSDELAELANQIFGGELTAREDGDFDFEPNAEYFGAYADASPFVNILPENLCEKIIK